MRLVLATRNQDKIREIRLLLDGLGIELLSLDMFPSVISPEESGRTFEENARLKAVSIRDQTGLAALADDSGLEVEALGGLPGVRSARFAGDGADTSANNRRLLAVLRGLPPEDRAARFVCVACLAHVDGRVVSVEGALEGRITESSRGTAGFGYDPLFEVVERGRTLAELGMDVKNRISHRARAMRRIRDYLVRRARREEGEPFG